MESSTASDGKVAVEVNGVGEADFAPLSVETLPKEQTKERKNMGQYDEMVDVLFGKKGAQNGTENGVDRLPLDRPNIRVIVVKEIRISGINHCWRQLWLEGKEVEPTDKRPARNQNMMDMGGYLEPFVKKLMLDDGWVFESEDAVVEWVHGRSIIAGHPDAVVSHPILTEGQPAIVEIKTRESGLAKFAWDFGVERSHPETVQQAAMYSKALFGEAGDVFIATLSRDDGEYQVERIPAERVERAYEMAMERVELIGRLAIADEMPEPEFPQGDSKCKSCVYRTLCGNAEEPEVVGEGGLTDEELELQIVTWAEANKAAPKPSSPEAKSKSAAADTLKAHMIAAGDFERDVEVDGVTYRLKLSESPGKEIDLDALNELVAPEIREQVVVQTVKRSFRVRAL